MASEPGGGTMSVHLMIGDLEQELAGTRRVLERLPDERFDWRPHERSMTLGGLATHLVNVVFWQASVFQTSELDLAEFPSYRDALLNRSEVLAEFDSSSAKLTALATRTDPAALAEEWVLRRGDAVLARLPRGLALRTFGISHMIHHRAQLTVYLRLLDVPVPGVYGPSRDDLRG